MKKDLNICKYTNHHVLEMVAHLPIPLDKLLNFHNDITINIKKLTIIIDLSHEDASFEERHNLFKEIEKDVFHKKYIFDMIYYEIRNDKAINCHYIKGCTVHDISSSYIKISFREIITDNSTDEAIKNFTKPINKPFFLDAR